MLCIFKVDFVVLVQKGVFACFNVATFRLPLLIYFIFMMGFYAAATCNVCVHVYRLEVSRVRKSIVENCLLLYKCSVAILAAGDLRWV